MNGVETAYAAAWRVVRALPAPVARGAFTVAADLTVRRNTKGVARLRENLRRVAGEENLDALVRAAMRSYLRYYLEAFRLPGYSRKDIVRMFRLEGEERLRDDVLSGRGAVVALPHGGNWDLAGAWAAATGLPLVAIAERIRVVTQDLADRFAAGIARHPEDWHMLQRMWR